MSAGQVLPVGLGEIRVSREKEAVLVCYGLGSCVGIALYDPVVRVAGMVHVVLPDSSQGRGHEAPGKFADTAVPALLSELVALGANRSRLNCRIAGGARMLSVSGGSMAKLDIGARNGEAVRAALEQARVPVAAADMGGNYGRTVSLFVTTGRVLVSTVGRGEKDL